jgi:hypothetical protein
MGGIEAHAALNWIFPVLLYGLAAAPAVSGPVPDPRALADRIAERYGSERFQGVASLRYDFNVRYGGKDIKREWTWFPQQDSVVYRGPDPKGVVLQASYSRKNAYSMGSETVAVIDKTFINDQYWLLFPLHLKWDKDLTLSVSVADRAGEAWRLTAIYPASGGYTPGDAYDLFVDSSATIKRWIFRKGNSRDAANEVTWEVPVDKGGLAFSLNHQGIGKDFKLWFTDVFVERLP